MSEQIGGSDSNWPKQLIADAHRKLRDQFAMAALSTIADLEDYTPEQMATYAYMLADAMMQERERQP